MSEESSTKSLGREAVFRLRLLLRDVESLEVSVASSAEVVEGRVVVSLLRRLEVVHAELRAAIAVRPHEDPSDEESREGGDTVVTWLRGGRHGA